MSIMLFVYGLAGVAGIWLIGRTHDRAPWRSTVVVLTTVTVALTLVLALIGGFGPLGVLATSRGAWHSRPFRCACSRPSCAPFPTHADTASAIYVVTFQVAIASGALLGGGLVDSVGIRAVVTVARSSLSRPWSSCVGFERSSRRRRDDRAIATASAL